MLAAIPSAQPMKCSLANRSRMARCASFTILIYMYMRVVGGGVFSISKLRGQPIKSEHNLKGSNLYDKNQSIYTSPNLQPKNHDMSG